MSECDKEIVRQQFITFYETQEVCDLLGIDVETLLEAFDDKLAEYVEVVDD